MRYLLLLFAILISIVADGDPPFLFPHGYFDTRPSKMKPFDAIYLNLMASSNLEYGGTTLEELDELDAIRKEEPRPDHLPRNREEDDFVLDRTPRAELEGDAEAKEPEVSPLLRAFRKLKIVRQKREAGNPFEEISTRAPPRSIFEYSQLKKTLKSHRSHHHHHHHHHSTTYKTTTTTQAPVEEVKEKPRQGFIEETTPKSFPTLIPDRMQNKIRRLPNNPYDLLDLSKPSILRLPLPPFLE